MFFNMDRKLKKVTKDSVKVGDRVIVSKEYLEGYNNLEFEGVFVEVLESTEYIPEDCVRVDIPFKNKGGLNVPFFYIIDVCTQEEFLNTMTVDNERKLMFPKGIKHDQNKLPLYTLIFKQFPLAIQAVAKRALAGHNKYIETDADWQNFARAGEQDPDRYKNAGMRHMLEEGEDTEKGMEGTTHEAAVVWNFLADLECKIRRENGESI